MNYVVFGFFWSSGSFNLIKKVQSNMRIITDGDSSDNINLWVQSTWLNDEAC